MGGGGSLGNSLDYVRLLMKLLQKFERCGQDSFGSVLFPGPARDSDLQILLPLPSHALSSAGDGAECGADQCARSSAHRRRAAEVLPGDQPSRVPLYPWEA